MGGVMAASVWGLPHEKGCEMKRKYGNPVVARASTVTPGLGGPALLKAVLRDCLAHVLPNASAVAQGSLEPEHIHQMRVALRRLRTALRELSRLEAGSDLGRHEPALAAAFRALGAVRDRQTVIAQLEPTLNRAGIGPVRWRSGDAAPDSATVAAEPRLQRALTELMLYSVAPVEALAAGQARPRRLIKRRIKKLHAEVSRNARRFQKLPVERQHRVRKRLKRLRYLMELVQPMFGGKRMATYLRAVHAAQDALGRHNDVAVARALLDPAALDASDPATTAADAWLAQEATQSARQSARALRKLPNVRRVVKTRPGP